MKKRRLLPQSGKILAFDQQKRMAMTEIQQLQQKKNEMAKAIGTAKKEGTDATLLFVQSEEIKTKLERAEKSVSHEAELELMISSLPTLLADDVPEGEDEENNVVIRQWGKPPSFDFAPKQHFELGEQLGLMDFEQTARISGSRFVTLKGALARLERALAQFMLDLHIST
ncbi:MAG: hypothetical protein Q8O19_05165, partial [Rectinemataceae bacterium]|nr:hypothetical protein [Rectinemataceae bacterium]